jgi:hypothetical protein
MQCVYCGLSEYIWAMCVAGVSVHGCVYTRVYGECECVCECTWGVGVHGNVCESIYGGVYTCSCHDRMLSGVIESVLGGNWVALD